MELLNKKIIICPITGRLGNQLLNTILAISLCIQHDINLIKLPKKPLFYDKDFIFIDYPILKCDPDIYHKAEVFYMHNFWKYDFKLFQLEKYKDKIKSIINKTFFFPKIKRYNNNILHIHIRSGDIMQSNKGGGMVQPPCIFYENEIIKKKWEKVIIVSEDTINPCINYLVGKYDNVIYFGKNSLEYDINELLSSTNIMIGRGTFIQTLSLFMPHLQQLHYPDDGDDRMHYFTEVFNPGKCIKHIEYKEYFNEIKKMGGWNYNEYIGNFMLKFKI